MSAENPAAPDDPKAHRWRATTKPTEGFKRVEVKTSARRKKALVLVALILALTGAIAAWVFYTKDLPATAFVTMPIREYSIRQFPANAYAVQDSDLLLRHFPEGLRQKDYTSQTRAWLLNELNALETRKEEALVVHLRAHGLRDDQGVYVLPGDADPVNPASWVPLAEVLEKMRKCPARHKLLLLDIMQPLADAKLGILTDNVAAGVKDVLDREDTSGLLILCACAPGQVSLDSDDLHLSVFAYYLDQGLSGRADGYNAAGRRDSRVSVKELAEYTRQHVDRWAMHNRATRQTPVLYGKGEDFPLVGYDPDAITPPAEFPALEPLPGWLADLWKMRDDWQAGGWHRRAPGNFQRLEALLLRAENSWRGGFDPEERIRPDLGLQLKQVVAAVKRLEASGKEPARHSLANARGPAQGANPALVEGLRGLLQTVAPDSTAKAEEVAKAKGAFQEKLKDTPYVEIAAAVFETAVKDPALSIKKLRLLRQVLDGWKGQRLYVEMAYLQRLDALAGKVEDRVDWPWPLEIVNQLLVTVQEGEKVAAADAAALPWIEEAAQAADEKRRAGEKVLFTERFTEWGKALALLNEAAAAYRTLSLDVDVLVKAAQVRDDALAFLPGYVPYLNRLRQRAPEDVETWQKGLRGAVELYQTMAKPNPALLESVDGLRSAVRANLLATQRSFDFRQSQFLKRGKQAQVGDYADFEMLLASPRLSAEQRTTLWMVGRKLARELLEETRAADAQEALGEPLPAGFGKVGAGDAQVPGTGDPKRRAELSIDLLTMAGLKDVSRLQQALTKAVGDPTGANWRPLGAGLYTAWASDVPAEFRAARAKLTASDQLIRADRLSRISDLLGQNQDSNLTIPQAVLRRQEETHSWQWLGRRFQAESTAAGSNTPYGAFCAEAAEDYAR